MIVEMRPNRSPGCKAYDHAKPARSSASAGKHTLTFASWLLLNRWRNGPETPSGRIPDTHMLKGSPVNKPASGNLVSVPTQLCSYSSARRA